MSFRWPHPPGSQHQGENFEYNNEIELPSTVMFPADNDVMAAASAYADCWRSGEADRGGQRQRSRGCCSHSSDSLVSFKTPLRAPSLIYCSCRLIPTTNTYFPALSRLALLLSPSPPPPSNLSPQIRELTRPTTLACGTRITSHAALSWIQHTILKHPRPRAG